MRGPLGQPLRRRHPQRDLDIPDFVAGAGDSLGDGGALVCRSARAISAMVRPDPGPQRQRQLRCPVQRWMRTGEHHAQFVVAHRMGIGVLGAPSDLVDHRCQFLSGAAPLTM